MLSTYHKVRGFYDTYQHIFHDHVICLNEKEAAIVMAPVFHSFLRNTRRYIRFCLGKRWKKSANVSVSLASALGGCLLLSNITCCGLIRIPLFLSPSTSCILGVVIDYQTHNPTVLN